MINLKKIMTVMLIITVAVLLTGNLIYASQGNNGNNNGQGPGGDGPPGLVDDIPPGILGSGNGPGFEFPGEGEFPGQLNPFLPGEPGNDNPGNGEPGDDYHWDYDFEPIAFIYQEGNDNDGRIDQHGEGNWAGIKQFGDHNNSAIDQYGDNNFAKAVQFGTGNDSNIEQDGYKNKAGIGQSGYDNEADIKQTGDYNKALITQMGSNNSASIEQNGNGLNLDISFNW
ncbi:MAG: hypothetical protein ACOCWE_04660, partial [Bacillota bacterium]